MEVKIRQEIPADYRETEEMTREAFWNQYAPGCMEHYLLHVMRNSHGFVPAEAFGIRGADGIDRSFPPKEKQTGVKMQKRIQELAAMVNSGENY